jgi:hypothetical protein
VLFVVMVKPVTDVSGSPPCYARCSANAHVASAKLPSKSKASPLPKSSAAPTSKSRRDGTKTGAFSR